MDLSIIITNYNTRELLSSCLTSLYRTLEHVDFSFEIIVVDNASVDRSAEMIQKTYPKVLIIKNKTNLGFGKANNQGIRKSTGAYILLLNSDTEARGDAIQKLLLFSRRHPSSFVGPKLLNIDGSDQTSCGPFFSLPVVFAVLFLKGDVLGITRWSPRVTKKVDWVSGACLIAPRKLFFDDLFFDESIFMYMDEIDLLYRAKKKGYAVYFYPESRVVHVGSGSSINRRKGPILSIYRGFMQFYQKFYPASCVRVLRRMLQCKAFIGIILGICTGNKELKNTYEEAFKLV